MCLNEEDVMNYLKEEYKDMPIRVFISQSMRGKSDEEIIQERVEAMEYVKEQFEGLPVEFIDSLLLGSPYENNSLKMLGESIKKLSNAHAAYFVDGWEDSRGCVIEHQCCEAYNIKIL